MNMAGITHAIEAWPLAGAIRGDVPGTEWLFPIVETGHVLALAVVFGSILIVDLRLLGLCARDTPVSALTAELLPWTWGAWFVAALFGLGLFISHASGYLGNPDFIRKFVCMGLAGLNMAVFHLGAYRGVARWDTGATVPAAKIAGAVSIVLWIGVVYFGRLVGFSGL